MTDVNPDVLKTNRPLGETFKKRKSGKKMYNGVVCDSGDTARLACLDLTSSPGSVGHMSGS